ncbi:MAG: hypothetical protein GQ545_00255 [Candidatus Aminicenantes bacterium]|nr:hypothetical protein [Candidatus Aminicenantes bacterium]
MSRFNIFLIHKPVGMFPSTSSKMSTTAWSSTVNVKDFSHHCGKDISRRYPKKATAIWKKMARLK